MHSCLLKLKSKKGGFVNYFGHQRFGGGVPAASVGRAIVLGHYKAAVRFLLDSGYAADDDERKAKEMWEQGPQNLLDALAAMPAKNAAERRVLSKLSEVMQYKVSGLGCRNLIHNWMRLSNHRITHHFEKEA